MQEAIRRQTTIPMISRFIIEKSGITLCIHFIVFADADSAVKDLPGFFGQVLGALFILRGEHLAFISEVFVVGTRILGGVARLENSIGRYLIKLLS